MPHQGGGLTLRFSSLNPIRQYKHFRFSQYSRFSWMSDCVSPALWTWIPDRVKAVTIWFRSGGILSNKRVARVQYSGNLFRPHKRKVKGQPCLSTIYQEHSPRSPSLSPERHNGNDNDSSNNPRVGYGNNP